MHYDRNCRQIIIVSFNYFFLNLSENKNCDFFSVSPSAVAQQTVAPDGTKNNHRKHTFSNKSTVVLN